MGEGTSYTAGLGVVNTYDSPLPGYTTGEEKGKKMRGEAEEQVSKKHVPIWYPVQALPAQFETRPCESCNYPIQIMFGVALFLSRTWKLDYKGVRKMYILWCC